MREKYTCLSLIAEGETTKNQIFTIVKMKKEGDFAFLARRAGFEPVEAVHLARFPSVCLKPLDHLRKWRKLAMYL